MRATWKNVKKSWSWKALGTEVAIGAATGGIAKLAKAGKLAKFTSKARGGARVTRCRALTAGSRFANKVSRGRIPAKAFCFVAGTPVVTPSGTVAIESIRPGDLVLSRDPLTGRTEPRQVERVFLNRTTELVHVGVGDETISATPSHPFWVEGTGWVDAGDLEAGMELSLADGDSATITSVVREHLASPVDVYNFQVADFHTYFVASAGVWVHNDCAAEAKGGVYTLRDATGRVMRTGRTKDLAKRRLAHRKLGLEFRAEFRTDSRDVQRGLEGMLYRRHPEAMKSNGGLNMIRAIARRNKNSRRYGLAAARFLAGGR